MERLESAFRNCEKLQKHMRLLLDKGGLYKTLTEIFCSMDVFL